MANLQLYNQNLPANGKMILDPANFFFLLSAAAVVNMLLVNSGNTELMNGIPAGVQIKRTKLWRQAILSGTAGTNVQFFYGDEFSREDQTNFQTQIASIAGNVATLQAVDSNGGNLFADVSVPATTLDNTIIANANRRFLIVGSLSNNAPGGAGLNLRLQPGAGAALNEGIELQAGTSYQVASGAQWSVYNPAAVAQKYWHVDLL